MAKWTKRGMTSRQLCMATGGGHDLAKVRARKIETVHSCACAGGVKFHLLTALSTSTEHVNKSFVCLGNIHGAPSPTVSIRAYVAHAYEA